jgi:prepilin-type N-terminal cleavage/methylation domain-containing protein
LVLRELLKTARITSAKASKGLSLIELLVAMIISLILIHAMAHIMVSEVKLTQSFEEHSNIKDSTIRVASMMQKEISYASDLSVPATDPTTCGLNDPLVIVGPRKMWTIVYGFAASNPPAGWIGPMTLYRCGPPYDTNGNLNFASGQTVKSVVLDKLSLTSPWDTVINSGDLANLSNSLSRGIRIQFNMQSSKGELKPYVFGARSAINPLYAFGDQVANDSTYLTSAPSPCDDASALNGSTNILNSICYQTLTSHQIIYNSTSTTEIDKRQHFYVAPNAGTISITGSPLFEDIVYLPNLKSAYTIQKSSTSTAACTRASCYLTSGANEKVSLQNVNYLIFPDAQIGI